LADKEMSDIQLLARREQLTVGEWVRRTLREARKRHSVNDSEARLKAIRRAAEYSFPTGDIDQSSERSMGAPGLDVGQGFGELSIDGAALRGRVLVVGGREFGKDGDHAAGHAKLEIFAVLVTRLPAN